VAQLKLARRHLTRMQADEALALYDELLPKFPWMVCVLHYRWVLLRRCCRMEPPRWATLSAPSN
jgi:hypothetical protein